MPRTLVILHPGGLGDLLLAVPAMHGLRERFPDCQLLLCGQGQAAEFLVECGLADRWLSVQSTACTALFGGAVPDDTILKDWLSRCDLAVGWTRDDAGSLSETLKDCGAAAVLVQSPFASTLSSVHQAERFAEIVDVQTNSLSMTSLSTPEALRAQAEMHLEAYGLSPRRPLALIHPGSGSRHKCVKPEILPPVLEGLEAEGFEPLLLQGPADEVVIERLLLHLPRRLTILRGLPVRLLAGLLSQVELYLGHDSGVTHLAALLGTPTVALFGPTEPMRWAPRGPTVMVIRGKPCQCPSWEDVRNCIEKPCLELSPQDILAACRTVRAVGVNPRIS
jgi:ADP-heptose:LPS heptosyltransferase